VKRTSASIAAFALVLLLAWYGGLDLDVRGFWQAFALCAAVYAGVCIYLVPFWPKEKS